MKINENIQVGEIGKTLKSLFKQYILFENSDGQTGSITLIDDIANYDVAEVHYGCDGYYYFEKVENPNGKNIGLMTNYVSEANSNLYLYTSSYAFNNNQLEFQKASNVGINDSNNIFDFGSNSYIRIYKIIAYKS